MLIDNPIRPTQPITLRTIVWPKLNCVLDVVFARIDWVSILDRDRAFIAERRWIAAQHSVGADNLIHPTQSRQEARVS